MTKFMKIVGDLKTFEANLVLTRISSFSSANFLEALSALFTAHLHFRLFYSLFSFSCSLTSLSCSIQSVLFNLPQILLAG